MSAKKKESGTFKVFHAKIEIDMDINNPDPRLTFQRSELVKAHVDQPKFFENYVVYVITPMNNTLVRGTVQAL